MYIYMRYRHRRMFFDVGKGSRAASPMGHLPSINSIHVSGSAGVGSCWLLLGSDFIIIK